jgi:hypothetical protein
VSTQRIGGTVSPANRLLTSYEGQNVPEDFELPPVGIEDVDRAMFNLFNKQVPLHVTTNGKTESVPIIFASGERFATRARQNPVRDDQGQFILPLMTIERKSLSTDKMFMGGRGIGVDTGDLTIKRRLSPKDRRYQNTINKLALEHQKNVTSAQNFVNPATKQFAKPDTHASRRESYDKGDDQLLDSKLGQNIFEIITMPFPQFFVAKYSITIWTQYLQHNNQIIERIMTNYNPNQTSFKLETDKGYWFVAYFDDEWLSEDNTEDFPDEERILKHTISVEVPAYIVAPRNDADPSPIRSYVSAPQISFGIYAETQETITDERNSNNPSGDIDKFVLSDVTPLDIQGNPKRGRTPQSFAAQVVVDPISGKRSIRFVKIISKNTRIGETVVGAEFIDDVDVVLK